MAMNPLARVEQVVGHGIQLLEVSEKGNPC